MAEKLFFFPQKPKSGEYKNPYSQNYKDCLYDHFDIVDKDAHQSGLKAWGLLKYSTKADIYVLNWVESIPFLKYAFLQYLIVLLSFFVMKQRRVKIVWMFHNIRPHQGENWMTNSISKWLFKNASLVISHSQEAAEYAKERAKCKVEYRCHPVMPIETAPWSEQIESVDVFIWGAIIPYKGIAEFISLPEVQSSDLKIKIIGGCKDSTLDEKIKSCANNHISYENRRADFAEIAAYCKAAKYVLFPYVGECVSSSGALIDTIVLGGTPVGPNVGAFIDLKQTGVCLTYTDYGDLLGILTSSNYSIMTNVNEFIKENSWSSFACFLVECIKSLESNG